MRMPIFTGALGSTDIARLHWDSLAVGAAVSGVSLEIPANQYVAFVGPSGSGKSTVLSLVLRFYDATRGSYNFV